MRRTEALLLIAAALALTAFVLRDRPTVPAHDSLFESGSLGVPEEP